MEVIEIKPAIISRYIKRYRTPFVDLAMGFALRYCSLQIINILLESFIPHESIKKDEVGIEELAFRYGCTRTLFEYRVVRMIFSFVI